MSDSNLSVEQQAYERDDLWNPDVFDAPNHIERLRVLAQRIPADAGSVLDVGCGGGLWLQSLATGQRRFNRLCGVDRSHAALKFVKTEKHAAGIDNLPFADREFDLVASFEVIEHLPVDVYKTALGELARTAAKYVMISVPFNELLEEGLVRCPECRAKYSPDFHMRSFDRQKLDMLFDDLGFRCIELFEIHEMQVNRWVKEIRSAFGASREKAPPPFTVCPVCRFAVPPQNGLGPPGPTSGRKNILKEALKLVWPKEVRYEWIAAVYRRRV